MDFSSSKSLARELVIMRLMSKEDANSCLRELDRNHRTGADLLDVITHKNLLTPFQIECIRKLDTALLVLGGNRLLYPNAAGSFARVFRGENIETGQMVAVKVLRNRWNNDPDTIDLFRREAELGKQLKHPNIVPIYDIGFESEYHYFTMEFIEGGNLRDFVQIRKQVEPLETLKYSLDMARGLEYALKFGVTHRDLKTTNVVFSMDGVAKLIDFGLATDEQILKTSSESAGTQTALEYSTLEKGTGAPRNDPRSDLFFLGTIMYEMLLGQPPYPRTRSREERKQITRYRNIRPLSDALPGCPRSVTEIVERLLHISPEERYQSAGEAIVDMQSAHAELLQKDNKTSPMKSGGAPQLTLLCVESRTREQDILREYFTRHGFRVLMLSDIDRATNRITSNPPDLVLFMLARADLDEAMTQMQALAQNAQDNKTPSVIVLPDQKLSPADDFDPSLIRFVIQPQPLRQLRNHLNELATENGLVSSSDI